MIEESPEELKAEAIALRKARREAVENLLDCIESDPLPVAVLRTSKMLHGAGEALDLMAHTIHTVEEDAQGTEELKETPNNLYESTGDIIETVLVISQRLRQRIKTRLSSFSGE